MVIREQYERLRNLPVEAIAEQTGYVQDGREKTKWHGPAGSVSITGEKFINHVSQASGGGSIDFVMDMRQCSFKDAVNWLLEFSKSIDAIKLCNGSPGTGHDKSGCSTRRPTLPPKSPEHWEKVHEYLVKNRALPSNLIDELHDEGLIYASSWILKDEKWSVVRHPNSVFVKTDILGKPAGAVLKGVSGSHMTQTVGAKKESWFRIGNQHLPRHIFVTESCIDALSLLTLAREIKTYNNDILVISSDGAGGDLMRLAERNAGAELWMAQDADEAGDKQANSMSNVLRWNLPVGTKVWRIKPRKGKDWNDELKFHQHP